MRLPTVNSFIHAFLLVQLVRRAAARSFSFKAVNQRGCLYPALEMRKIRSKNLLGNLAPFSAPLAVLLSSPFSLFFFTIWQHYWGHRLWCTVPYTSLALSVVRLPHFLS